MRKALPVLVLVASCVGREGAGPEPEIIYKNALARVEKEADQEKKLRTLEDAIEELGSFSYAFRLRERADEIRERRERESCEKSAAGREEWVVLLERLRALGAEDDPRGLMSEVREFVKAHEGTGLALALRVCYRQGLLSYLEHKEQKPIPWGAELPEALSSEEEEKLSRREEAKILASAALEEIKLSPASHSKNARKLAQVLARVEELDPAGPFAKALNEAIAEQKKALDRWRSKRAEKAMTDAVNRAEGKGMRALVEELEAIRDEVAKTQVESLWLEHLEEARRKLAEEEARKRRESEAAAAVREALAQARKCGLDYEKAQNVLLSALKKVKGTKAERRLKKRLREVEENTPQSLNARALAVLRNLKMSKMRRIDGAIDLLGKVVEREEFTGHIDYSGSLAFQIASSLAKEFSAYSPELAQARRFTSSYDEAVHYYVYAASRNSGTDHGLLEAAELLLEMQLKERAKRCLQKASRSVLPSTRKRARKRLQKLGAGPER